MAEKFKMRVAVYLVLFRDEKTLLLRRFNSNYHSGEYSLVAGHVDGGETLARAVIREAKEEAGITIAEQNLRVAHTMHRDCPDAEYIDFFFVAEKWSGEPVNIEPEKCDDLSWFSLNELPKNTIPYIRLVLESIQKGIPFSEWREPGM